MALCGSIFEVFLALRKPEFYAVLFDAPVNGGFFLARVIREFTLQVPVVRPLILRLIAQIVRIGEPFVSRLLTTNLVYMLGIIHCVNLKDEWGTIMSLVLEVAVLLAASSEAACMAVLESRLTEQIARDFVQGGHFALKIWCVRYAAAFLPHMGSGRVRAEMGRMLEALVPLLLEIVESDEPECALEFLLAVLAGLPAGDEFGERILEGVWGIECAEALEDLAEAEDGEAGERARVILGLLRERGAMTAKDDS
jgi:hypothetical protein